MTVIHRVLSQVDPSSIPSQALGFQNLQIKEFTAVATLPPAGAYVTFAKAFGTPPHVDILEPGSPSLRNIGTYRSDIIRVRPGSFQWAGTPSLKMRWYAFGL